MSEMNYRVISSEIEKQRMLIHTQLERSLPYDKKDSRTRAIESFSFASDFFGDSSQDEQVSRSAPEESTQSYTKTQQAASRDSHVKDSKEEDSNSSKTNKEKTDTADTPIFVEKNPNQALDNYRARKEAGKKGVKQKKKRKPKLNEAKIERKENIIKILKQKRDASINDITALMKNYSSKTIQRDLKELIKDNLVVKEGSRRWSTYNLTF